MDVENQHPFVESEENQKQLDTSEENEEVLIEQRGDDALENQDEAAVDKESGGEEGMGNSEDMKIVAATEGINEPEDETGQEEIPQDTRQISDFEEENRGVEPADLELMVHVPKQVGFDEEDTEQNSDMEQEDNGMENEDTAVDREPADLELMVHVPKEDGFVDKKEQDELVVEADDDKVTDLDEDAEVENVPEVPKDTAVGRVPADQELIVHNPDNDREKISEISKEADSEEEPADDERKIDPEITKEPEIEKEPADLELMVHHADTDSNKPKSDKEQAQLELLVQKDENDNDDEVGHEEIHRNGDVITQKKPEIKAKPKSGSVKNSIAKFNETGAKKDKGMFITVQPDKCSACEKTVYAMEKLEMNKNVYHRGCFKCSHCSATLTAKTFSINEGVIYCTTHFKQLFARKGNYDEGFGRQQYKKKWIEEQLKKKDTSA